MNHWSRNQRVLLTLVPAAIFCLPGGSKVKFAFGVNDVIQLTSKGVGKDVIATMRQKAKTSAAGK
jgi:hypothetical protein